MNGCPEVSGVSTAAADGVASGRVSRDAPPRPRPLCGINSPIRTLEQALQDMEAERLKWERPAKELRIVACDACAGDGYIEYGHPNAPTYAYTSECGACGGSGDVEIEVEPIDEEDLP